MPEEMFGPVSVKGLLQWVHGPITVVMPRRRKGRDFADLLAVLREGCDMGMSQPSATRMSETETRTANAFANRERLWAKCTTAKFELSKNFQASEKPAGEITTSALAGERAKKIRAREPPFPLSTNGGKMSRPRWHPQMRSCRFR